MKIVADRCSVDHSYVAGEISIYRPAEFFRGDFPLQHDAGYLTLGMHSGVGSARSVQYHVTTIDETQRAAEFTLDRSQVTLHLPAMKVRAVVLDRKLEVQLVFGLSKFQVSSFQVSSFKFQVSSLVFGLWPLGLELET